MEGPPRERDATESTKWEKLVQSIYRWARHLLDRLMEFQELGILVPVLVFIVAVSIARPIFFSAYNITNLLRDISLISIIAFAMTAVLVNGGIDLSVGSVLALSGVAAGLAASFDAPVYILVGAGLLVGFLAGVINAMLIALLDIPPVIGTLGMFYLARGIVLVITGGFSFVSFPQEFLLLGRGQLLGIPYVIIFMVILGVLSHILLSHTRYGYWISAVGGNRESSRRAGLNIKLLRGSVYLLTGITAGIVGILLTARLSLAHPQAGVGYEFKVIAGVIIGGASLYGGRGTILGTLLGCIMLGMLTNAMILLGVSVYYQQIAVGVIIVLAVAVDTYRQKREHVPSSVVRTGLGQATSERPDLDSVIVEGTFQEKVLGDTSFSGVDTPIIEMLGITKFFGYVQALDSVDFEVYPNEVVALVGDNGAGKSTLMKILSGATVPDSGEIIIRNQKVHFRTPRDSAELGIAMLYQDLGLVDCRNVAANLFLGREPTRIILPWLVDGKRMFDATERILSGLRVTIASPRALAGTLSGGQRQVLAIGKCISQGAGVFILDEPTSALGVEEAGRMLTLIRELKAHGFSVVVISHNLLHIFSVADRIVVIRGGRNVGSWPKADTNVDEVVKSITGADLIRAE